MKGIINLIFPIGVSVVNASEGQRPTIEDLQERDLILLHNNEVLPADGIIKKGEANIDYSFVTGESLKKKIGFNLCWICDT